MHYLYLNHIVDVRADLCDVVGPLKQFLAIKLPASVTPRLLDLLPHVEVGLLPGVQHLLGLRGLPLDLGPGVPGRGDTRDY